MRTREKEMSNLRELETSIVKNERKADVNKPEGKSEMVESTRKLSGSR